MSRVQILGVPVDALTTAEVVNGILRSLLAEEQRQCICVNAESVVAARGNAAFATLLQQSALNLPDGVGIAWAARRQGVILPERVSGLDVLLTLCDRSADQLGGVRLFLLGGAPGVAEKAAEILKERNPSLVIAGTSSGSPREEDDIVQRIHEKRATVLFVAFGSPAQELWITRTLPRLPLVKVAMGVGGAFDFLAGVQRRAPAWLQRTGLEWLWRLCREPRKRWRRILNAVVVFPWMVLCSSGQRSAISDQH